MNDEKLAHGYDLEDLARLSDVPPRTVRYYRQIGLLAAPTRAGRRAFYGADQLPRLRLIATLRARGLALDAIARVIDDEDAAEHEQLGLLLQLGDTLQAPWVDDRAVVLDADGILAILGTDDDSQFAALESYGIAYRRPRTDPPRWDVPSLAMLHLAGEIAAAGVEPELAWRAQAALSEHLGHLADELVALFTESAGEGFAGQGTLEELTEGYEGLRKLAHAGVQLAFSREMEAALARFVQRGGVFEVERRVREGGTG